MDWDGLNTAPGSSHPRRHPWISHGKRVWEVLPSRWEIRGRRVSPALGIFFQTRPGKGLDVLALHPSGDRKVLFKVLV